MIKAKDIKTPEDLVEVVFDWLPCDDPCEFILDSLDDELFKVVIQQVCDRINDMNDD